MRPNMETRATQAKHGWRDHDGFVGPYQPGNGPRSDPSGQFPTGPEQGSLMPDVHGHDLESQDFDLHQHRNGRPAIFIFFRSAVW